MSVEVSSTIERRRICFKEIILHKTRSNIVIFFPCVFVIFLFGKFFLANQEGNKRICFVRKFFLKDKFDKEGQIGKTKNKLFFWCLEKTVLAIFPWNKIHFSENEKSFLKKGLLREREIRRKEKKNSYF